jgi:hypothetical protein
MPKGLALPESDRKFLWETENVAFQIIYKAGPAFAHALAAGDRESVAQFFAPDFKGTVLEGTPQVTDRTFARWETRSSDRSTKKPLDGNAFAQYLVDWSLKFRSPPQVQVQVIDLAPIIKDDFSGSWQGKWILRLAGEQGTRKPMSAPKLERMPPTFPENYQVSDGQPLEIVATGKVTWDHCPVDYLKDRNWISGWEFSKVVVSQSPKRLMTDVSASIGIDAKPLHDNWKHPHERAATVTGGVFACDVNNDGKIDLFVNDLGPPHLYVNQGGKFVDEAFERGLPVTPVKRNAVCLVDLNNDGWEDLVYGREIYENVQGNFVRRGSINLDPNTAGVSVADFDRDGLVDLYVIASAPSPDEDAHQGGSRISWVHDDSGPGNTLYRNEGQFSFKDVTQPANASAGKRSCFSAVWMDVNDDNWPDVYVINELGNNVLLINQQNGTFAEKNVGPKFDGFAMGVAAGDVNEDGRVDLYLGNMKSKVGQRVVGNLRPGCYEDDILERMRRWVGGNILMTATPDGNFAEVLAGVEGGGWSYGPVMIDFDNDGRLDLFSACGFISRSRTEPDG